MLLDWLCCVVGFASLELGLGFCISELHATAEKITVSGSWTFAILASFLWRSFDCALVVFGGWDGGSGVCESLYEVYSIFWVGVVLMPSLYNFIVFLVCRGGGGHLGVGVEVLSVCMDVKGYICEVAVCMVGMIFLLLWN